jgi:hypothetical protein
LGVIARPPFVCSLFTTTSMSSSCTRPRQNST